jgi:phosphoserine phosphatase RsbX
VTVTEVDASRVVELAVAARPKPGETVSGDDSVVIQSAVGILVAVVDGLGHGCPARHAAVTAVHTVRELADESLVSIVSACHEALRASRGAAMSTAVITADSGTMSWLGVGNVAGTLWRRTNDSVALPLLDGIVGHGLPPLEPTAVEVQRGDVLIVATDGVAPVFADSLPLTGSAADIAERLLADGTTNDDALVLVARYLGAEK